MNDVSVSPVPTRMIALGSAALTGGFNLPQQVLALFYDSSPRLDLSPERVIGLIQRSGALIYPAF